MVCMVCMVCDVCVVSDVCMDREAIIINHRVRQNVRCMMHVFMNVGKDLFAVKLFYVFSIFFPLIFSKSEFNKKPVDGKQWK